MGQEWRLHEPRREALKQQLRFRESSPAARRSNDPENVDSENKGKY